MLSRRQDQGPMGDIDTETNAGVLCVPKEKTPQISAIEKKETVANEDTTNEDFDQQEP